MLHLYAVTFAKVFKLDNVELSFFPSVSMFFLIPGIAKSVNFLSVMDFLTVLWSGFVVLWELAGGS